MGPLAHLRAGVIAAALLAWTAALIPVQAAALALRLPLARIVPKLYHRGVSLGLGVEIRLRGNPSAPRPALFVCNHASWVDIVVLSCVLDASFVAKAEVARWPLFGLLAKLARTVFVVRRPSRSEAHRDDIRRRLEQGDSLILFAEGTSGDGNRVLPFNSTFFAVAQAPVHGRPLAVQPVTLAYTGYNSLPMTRRERPWLAWYGEMGLMSHLWRLLALGPARADVWLHEPVSIERYGSRKALAGACRTAVADGLAALLAGRRPDSANSQGARASRPHVSANSGVAGEGARG